ncbi:MAG TPA: hypothetical protein VFH90_08375 [Candidatus Limnocylindria bacterium]|nr:hypothetical protein [Candidatus Limnocylindria bacterium]
MGGLAPGASGSKPQRRLRGLHRLVDHRQQLEFEAQLELEEEFPVGEAFLDEDDDIPRPLDELDRLDQLTEA